MSSSLAPLLAGWGLTEPLSRWLLTESLPNDRKGYAGPVHGKSSGIPVEVQTVQQWSRIGPNLRARLLRSAVSPPTGSVRKR